MRACGLCSTRRTCATWPFGRTAGGLGYGKRIFTALIDLAMENSMAMITLEVRRSNTVAQNLYHACGMLDVGYRKRYYEDNKEDALIMYRDFVYPEAGENEA